MRDVRPRAPDLGQTNCDYVLNACGKLAGGEAAFSLQAFWINRAQAVPDDLGMRPKAVLERLTDLIGLISE